MQQVNNGEDILDSRDINERLKELQEEYEEAKQSREHRIHFEQSYEFDELQTLEELVRKCESTFPDWNNGVDLIRNTYFETYAIQYAEDIGMRSPNNWPFCHIDWDKASEDLKTDYSEVDFGGVTYWGRD